MSDAPGTCHNCAAPLHGRFCAECGQEALPLNPGLRDLARDLTHEVLDVDGRVFRSVRHLLLSPGLLTRDYFEGRRVRWLPPIRMYLLFSVVYFALTGFFDLDVHVTGTDQETASALRKLGFASEEELRATVTAARATWMPRVMFVLVPLFAWFVQLMRRQSGRTYPQHLLFALHAHAAWFAIRAVVAALRPLLPRVAESVFGAASIVYGIVYLALAFQVAYGGTRRRAVRDAAIVLIFYGLAIAAVTAAIVTLIVVRRT